MVGSTGAEWDTLSEATEERVTDQDIVYLERA